MSHTYYLQQSKQIYAKLKERHLPQVKERATSFLKQLVDPNAINPEFKQHVADLRYLLSHTKKGLDAEEQILKNTPWEVRGKVEKELLQIYGDKIVEGINKYALLIEPICQNLTPDEHFIYKTYFQEHLLEFVAFASAFSTRAIQKPNGYAGDYRMMEMLCDDNVYVGSTLFEKCCHRFSVTSPSGAPVKNRLELIYNTLEETVLEKLKNKKALRVLDLACGPSIPVQRFLKKPESASVDFFFLDQDADALSQLQHQLRNIKETLNRPTQFHFYNQPIQELFSNPETLSDLANQDLIISSGLFDYLDDNMATMLLNVLYHNLLAPGGTLLIGNLCPAETTKIFQWYVNEWPLNFRTKEELLALAPEGSHPEILAEKLGFNLFLKIQKK